MNVHSIYMLMFCVVVFEQFSCFIDVKSNSRLQFHRAICIEQSITAAMQMPPIKTVLIETADIVSYDVICFT